MHARKGEESGEGEQRERERAEPSCCIFYILLTFVAGTVRSRTRGVSAKSMVVWRRTAGPREGGGEEEGSRSRVTSFILFARRRLLVVAAARLGMRARTSFDPRGPRP